MTDNQQQATDETGARTIDISEFGSGVIIIATGSLGRYRDFDLCMRQLIAPQGTEIQFSMGVNIADHFNKGLHLLFNNPNHKWVWFMGDDHTFSPDLLIKLLDRRLPVVTPFCLRRAVPFLNVLHTDFDENYINIPNETLKGETGVYDISGKTIGNAGTLISRDAVERLKTFLECRHEKLKPHYGKIRATLENIGMTKREIYGAMSSFRDEMMPFFENGKTHPSMGGSDLYFFSKLNDAGIPHYLDLDNVIGHIMHCPVYPVQIKEGPNTGTWGAHIVPPGQAKAGV